MEIVWRCGFADAAAVPDALKTAVLMLVAHGYERRDSLGAPEAVVPDAEEVEAIVEETGYERIHIVAHSLGGVVARYYVTRLGGDERVHTLATLGSPHTGTLAAYLLPTSLTRQLRPGSGLMPELNQPAPGCRTRVIAIWSDTDEAVVPAVNASLRQDGVATTNIRMHGVGHLSLPILPSVVHEIATRLTQIDSEGTPTASVTDITSRQA